MVARGDERGDRESGNGSVILNVVVEGTRIPET